MRRAPSRAEELLPPPPPASTILTSLLCLYPCFSSCCGQRAMGSEPGCTPKGMPPHPMHQGLMPLSSHPPPPAPASPWASLEVLGTVGGLAGDGHPCDLPSSGLEWPQVLTDSVGNII